MGSAFSIVNNTDRPIWVKDGVCHAALWGAIGGVATLVTFGAFAGVYAVGAASAAAVAAGAGEAVVIAGIAIPAAAAVPLANAGIAVSTVSGLLAITAGSIAGLSSNEQKRVLSAKKILEKKLNSYRCIPPGGRYTVMGSLSLVKTVSVVYNDYREAKRNCWTGATNGSRRIYLVTENF